MNSKRTRRDRLRGLLLPVGIVLFVMGFVLTLVVVQSDQASVEEDGNSFSEARRSTPSSSPGFVLVSGIMMSLTGVVLATVGPATGLVKRRD